jgi:hypothetical protein
MDTLSATSVKCFIVGCSRSGTTLLTVLLDRHSKLAMTPETGFYGEIAPKIQGVDQTSLLTILSGWTRLPELGLSPDTILENCIPRPTPAVLFDTILRLYASSREKPYCGEKTPQHWRHMQSILDDFPNSRVLFMMRDGRDVALSLRGMPWWPSNLALAADEWRNAAKAAEKYLATYPSRVLLVRYEDLVSSPQIELTKVMKFLELHFECGQLDVGISSEVVLARSMLWKGRALNVVDETRVGHWRVAATPDEAAYLNRYLQEELLQFRYA